MGHGSWVMGHGSWVVGHGSWVMGQGGVFVFVFVFVFVLVLVSISCRPCSMLLFTFGPLPPSLTHLRSRYNQRLALPAR